MVTGPPRSSAARERLEGLRSTIRPDITLHTTEAGQWSETDGILAFNSWYGVFRSRREEIHAIAGQSDDLTVGASKGGTAVGEPGARAHVRPGEPVRGRRRARATGRTRWTPGR